VPSATELWFSVSEAAEVCGVDVSTIRRRLARKELPGARRKYAELVQSPWEIPTSALVKAGLCTGSPLPPGAHKTRAEELERLLQETRRELEDRDALIAALTEEVEKLRLDNSRLIANGESQQQVIASQHRVIVQFLGTAA
jgi:hypothetical protein